MNEPRSIVEPLVGHKVRITFRNGRKLDTFLHACGYSGFTTLSGIGAMIRHDYSVIDAIEDLDGNPADPRECTCPLIDVSGFACHGTAVAFLLGDPQGSGCPIHETEAMRNERQVAEDLARYGDQAEPGHTYLVGEHGPKVETADPKPIDWARERGYELWRFDADTGRHVQIEPKPEPPKRAWWEYRWPPLAMALLGLIASIIAIAMALGG